MKFIFRSSSVSPHQAPLALALSRHFEPGLLELLYTGKPADPFRATGVFDTVRKFSRHWEGSAEDWREYDDAYAVLENHRDFAVLKRRAQNGKIVLHPSERWFKPERLKWLGIYVPGFLKMLFPFALKRALAMLSLLRNKTFLYLPMGIHAAQDMARLCGLMHGDLRCIFRPPALEYENMPGGRLWVKSGRPETYGLHKMRLWGYFVAPSSYREVRQLPSGIRRVLWVGRFLSWKRVDTIIKAVMASTKVELNLYGAGPCEPELRSLARGCDRIRFNGLIPLAEVRAEMRRNDIYVLSSNAWEGWGAVVNEALEERMMVLGTYEAGSSATILPRENLFHAGDWLALRKLLNGPIRTMNIGKWNVEFAAKQMVNMIDAIK